MRFTVSNDFDDDNEENPVREINPDDPFWDLEPGSSGESDVSRSVDEILYDAPSGTPNPSPRLSAPMRTVRDESGKRYLLLKRSGETSLVRDPESGEQQYLDNAHLEPADGESPLVTASRAVPDPVRCVLTAVRDERTLGLLIEIDERGPVGVRELLGLGDLCESDLHGTLAELTAAGLIEEVRVAGERGYGVTETGREGLDQLRR